jgi:Xaa-Pro aminopeptidase
MIFTIEPGIYIKGLAGCRIENDILLTKNGVKILTNSKLIEIG